MKIDQKSVVVKTMKKDRDQKKAKINLFCDI